MATLRTYVTIISVILGSVVVDSHTCNENKRLLLDNEPSVDLGGEISRLQAQLLEQQKLINGHYAQLQQEVDTMKKELKDQKNVTATLQLENDQLKRTQLNNSQGSGSVFVRWGRNVCPSSANLVYTGYTAGKHHNAGGSGSDNLCLPTDPTWSNFIDGNRADGRIAYIYGTEIDTDDSQHIFNYPVNEQDMPCVVCQSNKASVVMIPARNNCYSGWDMEYHGYLMTGLKGYHAYNHVCMDENPEFLQHGSTNDNQHILYLVEGQCGSLPCPPYVGGRELACVVCSK